jgi:hypothetical protein
MLRIIFDFDKLQKVYGEKLPGLGFNYQDIRIWTNHEYYYAELPELNSEVPAMIKDLVEYFGIEEKIAGRGRQWRHGEYRHRNIDEAYAFFDRLCDDRILKMRARTQAGLIRLREIVLQIKPGDRNQIDGLIEPPVDAWNAGYEAGMTETEAAHRAEVLRLEEEIERLLGRKQSVAEEAQAAIGNIRGQLDS